MIDRKGMREWEAKHREARKRRPDPFEIRYFGPLAFLMLGLYIALVVLINFGR